MGHVSKHLFLLIVLLLFPFMVTANSSFAVENYSTQQGGIQNQNIQNTREAVTEVQNSITQNSTPGFSQSKTVKSSDSWNNRAVPMMSRLFVWIGFIVSIGLTAKILTAFNDQNIGLLTVIFVGSVGALVSMIFLPYLSSNEKFQPVSPIGFIVAVIVAFLLLLFYSKFLYIFKKEKE